MATKPKGGGWLKALVAGPPRKELFFFAASRRQSNFYLYISLRDIFFAKYVYTNKNTIFRFCYLSRGSVHFSSCMYHCRVFPLTEHVLPQFIKYLINYEYVRIQWFQNLKGTARKKIDGVHVLKCIIKQNGFCFNKNSGYNLTYRKILTEKFSWRGEEESTTNPS